MQKLTEFFATQNGHWVGLGMFSVKEGIQSTNPADLFNTIVLSSEFKDLKIASKTSENYNDYNIVSSIELGNVFSQSLVSPDVKQVWISTSQLNSLFTTKNAFKIYLGLLLAKESKGDNKVEFYDLKNKKIVSFGTILSNNHANYLEFESLIKNAYSAYNAANIAVKKMITASDKSVEVDPQAIYNYYRTLTSSLKPITHNQLLINNAGDEFVLVYDKVEKILNPSADLAFHISSKKYSAAIYDASILLSAMNEYLITDGKTKKYDEFKPVIQSFVKYGTLISTVANAQSSDEMKEAIEASILPVGSSAIKRNSAWSSSINAYVGAYASYTNEEDYIPTYGLSAPIGINFSKGFSKTGKGENIFKRISNQSYSINLQILDLGALVNYYLINGDTATIPNDFSVKLSNVFAPGFNVCYNIPKTPLSIAWGGQYIPTLYKYEQINGKNELTPTNAWRWQVSVLIDIPLFNLKVSDFKK